jgi:hypothetical protein
VFHDCLLDGKQCLRSFQRWSRHPDLNNYEAILETWDDRVCEFWVAFPPDRNHLNCEEWLIENKIYQSHMEVIDELISNAYS